MEQQGQDQVGTQELQVEFSCVHQHWVQEHLVFGRRHMTNCYTDFFVTTLEEPPSESEGEDGEDLSSDKEQDLQDQFNDLVDDNAETEDPGLDLEHGMTDSSDSPVIHCHSKRLQNISSSDSELSSEPVRSKKKTTRLTFPSQHSPPQVNLKSLQHALGRSLLNKCHLHQR